MDSNVVLVVTLFDQYTHSLETPSWTFSICVYVSVHMCEYPRLLLNSR